MGESTAVLLAKHFIGRRDVKAVQEASGAYHPERTPWKMQDINAHLTGARSLGYYLVAQDDTCRLFAFDIDLKKSGGWFQDDLENADVDGGWHDGHPREAWLSGGDGVRWLTVQLRSLAEVLAERTRQLIGVPVAVAYSGGKGLHVYGLTGITAAADARGAAIDVLRSLEIFEPTRGDNFWRRKPTDEPRAGWPSLEIEVFPKQDSLEGKDLGNLLRLPLGINLKTKRRAYFLKTDCRPDQLIEADPAAVLPLVANQ